MVPAELPGLFRDAGECVRRAGILCATSGSQGLFECPALLESACGMLRGAQSLLVSAAPERGADLKPAVQAFALQLAGFRRLLDAAAGFHRAVRVHAGEDAVSYRPGGPAFHPALTASADIVG